MQRESLILGYVGIIFSILLWIIPHAYAVDKLGWMNEDLTSKSDCLEKPNFSVFDISNITIDMAKQKGQWVNTGVALKKGRDFKIKSNISNVAKSVRRYLVLFRIDPRFEKPQVIVQKYNETSGKYEFHKPNGMPDIMDMISQSNKNRENKFEYIHKDANGNETYRTKINRFTMYLQFLNAQSDAIDVNQGDVITINLYDDNMNNAHEYYFFHGTNKYAKNEWPSRITGNPYVNIFSTRGLNTSSSDHFINNKIFYTNPEAFNNWNTDQQHKTNTRKDDDDNQKDNADDKNINLDKWIPKYGRSAFVGNPLIASFNNPITRSNLKSCNSIRQMPDDPKNIDKLCFYNMGEGMTINIGGSAIKTSRERFLVSKNPNGTVNDNSGLFYHKAKSGGKLTFTSDWKIKDMFNFPQNKQFMSQWQSFGNNAVDYLAAHDTSYEANFLHFGRYIMYIEIGKGDDAVNLNDSNQVAIEYGIEEPSLPASSIQGNSVNKRQFEGNAEKDGNLWIRVNPASEISGSVNLNIAHYTGDSFFSHVIYNDLIKKLIYLFVGSNEPSEPDAKRSLTEQIYTGISGKNADGEYNNVDYALFVRALLIIYIILYALMFLIGSVRVTATDLVARILKIAVVMMLLTEGSWKFFSEYLFNLFMFGSSELFRSVLGTTSQMCDPSNPDSCNLFGFIDPIFSKYTNGRFWALLGIQLLQFHNGLCFIAIMMIYSILIFFIAIIEVIVNFCVAFVAIAVLISLAPFFIIFILFERTRSYFNNWISSLFQFMISPTIMLIFFLMIDQLMTDHLSKIVVEACWDKYIDLNFVLDLHHIGIPLTIPFSLPFLPAIYFYVPQVQSHASTFLILISSSLLFYAYAKMSSGLVAYVNQLVNTLTNVHIGGAGSAANSIQGDLKSVLGTVTSRASKAGSYIKNRTVDRVIGQKYDQNKRDERDHYSNNSDYGDNSGSSDFGRKVESKSRTGETSIKKGISAERSDEKSITKGISAQRSDTKSITKGISAQRSDTKSITKGISAERSDEKSISKGINVQNQSDGDIIQPKANTATTSDTKKVKRRVELNVPKAKNEDNSEGEE